MPDPLVAEKTSLEVGVSGADLGQLATEFGTSTRMLVHHFGSKDALIAEAVEMARARQRRLFREWIKTHESRTLPNLLQALWGLMQAPQAQPYLRLFSEVYVLSVQQPGRFPGFSPAGAVHDWLPELAGRLRAGGADEHAALALAPWPWRCTVACCSTRSERETTNASGRRTRRSWLCSTMDLRRSAAGRPRRDSAAARRGDGALAP